MLSGWGRILVGFVRMPPIEISRECPLSALECYAYGDTLLGGGVMLAEPSDLRRDARV